MTDASSPTAIAGKPLKEADMGLFRETMERLLLREVSPAGAPLDEAFAQRLAQRLREARVSERCACGEPACKTYYFRVPEKPRGSVEALVFRFYARGEHLLHADSDGDIHKVQRLYEAQGPRTIFARNHDGTWEQRRV